MRNLFLRRVWVNFVKRCLGRVSCVQNHGPGRVYDSLAQYLPLDVGIADSLLGPILKGIKGAIQVQLLEARAKADNIIANAPASAITSMGKINVVALQA